VGSAPVNYSPTPNIQPVTKTSLTAKKQDGPQIGSGHNFAPKPYGGPQVSYITGVGVYRMASQKYFLCIDISKIIKLRSKRRRG
jgi:hypothetical protein